MPVYAECGGLMYLSRGIEYQGRIYQMVGAIPGDVKMHDKPIGRGYVHLKEDQAHPWPRPDAPPPIQLSPASGRKGERENQPLIFAHEFHYSSLENLPPDTRFAYHVERGYGIDGERDGLILHNLLASYTHLRTIGSCYWATRFVAFIRRQLEQHKNLESTPSNRQAI
jgi:cobyrinic acid a,c-diamide synthase